ncbi:hypothetical protein BZM27_12700 [Paraburkholderia steynii]|uniref:Uncharacterized protein n=1 Tax=Paraburkholderia steynii TaxID=1245441 RepID=A0A4R0XDA6_9BURK|nr:hypothetical protein BZM27_12700 [Paraburkholderia steynii]
MGLQFCDGMDAYGALADMTKKWGGATVGGAFNATGGKFGGGALSFSSTVFTCRSAAAPVAIVSGAWCYVAGWFKSPASPSMTSNGSSSGQLFMQFNGLGYIGFSTTTWAIGLYQGGSFLTQGSTPVLDGNWHWVEFGIKFNGGSSLSSCYVDGIAQWTNYTVNAAAAGAVSNFNVGGPNQNGAGPDLWDDVICWDDQGTTFNTFPLGPQRISTLQPNAAGDSTQFTPSTGANYACVNAGYGGTNSVSDSSTGNIDLYQMADLVYSPATVKAVVGNYYGGNPGTGTANLIPKVKSGGTVATGTTRALPIGSNAGYQQFWPLDPSSAAWTVANVNAIQIGMGD